MTDIYKWSRTASENDNADSGIDWAENQAANTVNDSARTMMARVAEWRDDLGATQTTGGTANAHTLTARSSFTAYATGIIVGFKAGNTNTGATTLNVNGIGAKAVRKVTTGGEVALSAGDITTAGLYLVIYDATANASAGAWILVNPGAVAHLGSVNTFTAAATFDTTVNIVNFSLSGASSGKQFTTAGNMYSSRDSTNSRPHVEFYNPNGRVGTIDTSGSSTAYNTSSDERLKDFEDANLEPGRLINDVAALLAPFTWKASGESSYGLSAQVLNEIAPFAVSPGGDDPKQEPWSVDASKLVWHLIAYTKRLEQRVAALEAR